MAKAEVDRYTITIGFTDKNGETIRAHAFDGEGVNFVRHLGRKTSGFNSVTICKGREGITYAMVNPSIHELRRLEEHARTYVTHEEANGWHRILQHQSAEVKLRRGHKPNSNGYHGMYIIYDVATSVRQTG
jgi:hypothetical protein